MVPDKHIRMADEISESMGGKGIRWRAQCRDASAAQTRKCATAKRKEQKKQRKSAGQCRRFSNNVNELNEPQAQ
jgi:hypothetical protein